MENKAYLIFSLNDSLYGVEAIAVQEIVFLPELTPIPETPHDIVGVLNLRGKFLSVMDLNLRFGYPFHEYSLTHSVIFINWQKNQFGLIVTEVHEVYNIAPETIKAQLFYSESTEEHSHYFVDGIAQTEMGIVMLLNVENLINYSSKKRGFIENAQDDSVKKHDTNKEEINQTTNLSLLSQNYRLEDNQNLSSFRLFCPNATLQEKAIFRERANHLKQQADSQYFYDNQMPLAVITLNGEYFGLHLEVVRELTDIHKVTPIPCTPIYIVGNINLRGEILTLVDIRYALNMPRANVGALSKAIVVQIADLVAGIVVDEVLDVIYLNGLEMASVPAAIHFTNDEYLRGTAPYREKMMGILDIHKMFTKGVLTVDEEV